MDCGSPSRRRAEQTLRCHSRRYLFVVEQLRSDYCGQRVCEVKGAVERAWAQVEGEVLGDQELTALAEVISEGQGLEYGTRF